jgi:Cu(I)/Ag(I) efflux system membrane fusion protein
VTRVTSALVLVAVIAAAETGGYWASQNGLPTAVIAMVSDPAAAETSGRAGATGPVIYYRHPDGLPEYSGNPVKTSDGRPFPPVLASEDVSFGAAGPESRKTAETPEKPETPGLRKVRYYRNPMGLPDTSPVPKKDGMGMDYLPVYDGEDTSDGSVTISAGRQQLSGVKTAVAAMGTIVRPVNIPGTVQLDERRISAVSTRTEAFVETVANVTTGDVIVEGQPLVSFYAREIATAGAQYVTDLKTDAASSSGGSRLRLENLGVPEKAISEIRDSRKVPAAITLTAPRSGVVLERYAVEGMMAAPGAVLFRIADTSHVWVMADVPEYEIGSIVKGAEATIKVRSLPGKEFKGKVDLIYPEIQSQTRTASIRIELPNPGGLLLANMYADVEIASGNGTKVVTVPGSAVIDSGDRQVVIIDKGDGKFDPHNVKVGMRGDGMAEISDGISAGDRVVVSANFLIDAESNLKSALNAIASPEAKP